MKVIKVKSGDSFAIINATDFDEKTHELYDGETLDGAGQSDAQRIADEIETRRQIEANRGVVAGAGPADTGRNSTGTFSTPTPTDVRYPNKNETEFENNHGAFIGKSAPHLRAEHDLPDAPGGIHPEAEAKRREAGVGADSTPADVLTAVSATEHQPKVGNRGAGEGAGAEQPATIPDDWEGGHVQTRMALARKLSGRDDVKSDEANGIIAAEVERRKAGG